MIDQLTHAPDLLERVPDPETVRLWLSESVRRTDLLRSLLRLARRKAAYGRPTDQVQHQAASQEVKPCRT